jgi:O-antigen/teichoic acid export membrane protein
MSYGQGFSDGVRVLSFQVIAGAIAAIIGVLGQYMISTGRLWSLIGLQAIWAIANISLTWIFRDEGAEGASVAYLMSYVIHLCTTVSYTYYLLTKAQSSDSSGLQLRTEVI